MLLRQMASGLGLPETAIQAIARKASHAYKTYSIVKRGGGLREIHHPSKQLKALQRWLISHVLEGWPVHSAAMAYRKHVSIADNARKHASSRYLLRMDFEKFFPSITDKDVRDYLSSSDFPKKHNWRPADMDLFTALVCRNGSLTIGAPTSPALSNALCFEFDRRVEAAARAKDVVYTRYADDLFFSTAEPDTLKLFPEMIAEIVKALPFPAGLRINVGKTRHSSKKGRRLVTGLVLRSDGIVGVGRDRKRHVRSLIHKFDSLTAKQRRNLAGSLAFIRDVEPDFINALILKFGAEQVSRVQKM